MIEYRNDLLASDMDLFKKHIETDFLKITGALKHALMWSLYLKKLPKERKRIIQMFTGDNEGIYDSFLILNFFEAELPRDKDELFFEVRKIVSSAYRGACKQVGNQVKDQKSSDKSIRVAGNLKNDLSMMDLLNETISKEANVNDVWN
jgi:hypothetical protein